MFETSLCQILFYVLAALAVLCAAGVVAYRNPVNSAMCMAVCFAMVAAIFFGMGAQFLGIVQLIVYAGAILVLFLFVVMIVVGVLVVLLAFLFFALCILSGVLWKIWSKCPFLYVLKPGDGILI